jgi:hypothetical protein
VLDDTPEPAKIKASLRRLAGSDEAVVIERAAEATDDPALERRGRRALEAFRLFRRAAAGAYRPGGNVDDHDHDREGTSRGDRRDDHFHRGHGTDLRRGGEPSSR